MHQTNRSAAGNQGNQDDLGLIRHHGALKTRFGDYLAVQTDQYITMGIIDFTNQRGDGQARPPGYLFVSNFDH